MNALDLINKNSFDNGLDVSPIINILKTAYDCGDYLSKHSVRSRIWEVARTQENPEFLNIALSVLFEDLDSAIQAVAGDLNITTKQFVNCVDSSFEVVVNNGKRYKGSEYMGEEYKEFSFTVFKDEYFETSWNDFMSFLDKRR